MARFLVSSGTDDTLWLQESNTCYCKADAVADSVPLEAEFMDAYRTQVSSLEGLSVVGSIGDCEFGSTFESALVLSFGSGGSVEEFAKQIEDAVMLALNSLYETTQEVL
jgi:hypothetical protein